MSLLKLLCQENYRMYNVDIAKITGVNGAIVLNWLVYLTQVHNNIEVFSPYPNICEVTALSINEIKTAVKKLKDVGFIKVVKKGIPSKNYYYILASNILTHLKSIEPVVEKVTHQSAEKLPTSEQENNSLLYNSNNNSKTNSNNSSNAENALKEKFEKFRIMFRSVKVNNKIPTVRGLETEYNNLKKKHKDYKEIINYLYDNIDLYKMTFKKRDYQYHLETYINKRQFEEVSPDLVEKYRLKKQQETPKPIEQNNFVYLSELPRADRKKERIDLVRQFQANQGKELIIDCEIL